MTALPEWIPVSDVLDYAVTGDESIDVVHLRRSRAITDPGAEARILATLEQAGIPHRQSPDPMAAFEKGYDVPGWVAPFLEATVPRSAAQLRVLTRAHHDVEFRNAGLTIWQLGGLEKLAWWLPTATRRKR